MVPEDIISIKGHQVEIASKQPAAGFPLQESNKQWIDVKQEESVMFLNSWEVKETEKDNKVYFLILSKTGSKNNAIQEFYRLGHHGL